MFTMNALLPRNKTPQRPNYRTASHKTRNRHNRRGRDGNVFLWYVYGCWWFQWPSARYSCCGGRGQGHQPKNCHAKLSKYQSHEATTRSTCGSSRRRFAVSSVCKTNRQIPSRLRIFKRSYSFKGSGAISSGKKRSTSGMSDAGRRRF